MGGFGFARLEEDAGTLANGHALALLPVARPRLPVLLDGRALVEAGTGRRLTRCRMHVGDLIVDLRRPPRQGENALLVPRGRALLLIPFGGDLTILSGDQVIHCPAETPWLCAADHRPVLFWRGCTDILAVYFHPERLNAAVSALTGDGRRLAATSALLPQVGDGRRLLQTADAMCSLFESTLGLQASAAEAAAAAFYQGLADHIVADTGSEVMQPVRVVSDAMRVVRDNRHCASDVEQLAATVGVTAGTLRKGFRACLGMTVKEYIRETRLVWAHERLESGMESRAIADMAVAAGFADTPSFSRAYLRRYGESASQTRARAVHRMADPLRE